MGIQYYNDQIPPYVHNKHTTYENTVLQEHSQILSGLRDTSALKALMETQSRIFVGGCVRDQPAQDFIDARFDKYFDQEMVIERKVSGGNTDDKTARAFNRAWSRIINDAYDAFLRRYKVDGSKAKIAVIDDELPEGGVIIESDDPRIELLNALEAQYKELVHNIKTLKPAIKIDGKVIVPGERADPEEHVDYTEDEGGV